MDEDLQVTRSEVVGSTRQDSALNYMTAPVSPGAVVLRYHDGFTVIHVLSQAEYKAFTEVNAILENDNQEHWLVLADSERMESVEVHYTTCNDGSTLIEGLRIETNMRRSPWFGTPPLGNGTWLHCLDQPHGTFICGSTASSELTSAWFSLCHLERWQPHSYSTRVAVRFEDP